MKLEEYSMGIGDHFGHQAKAQLAAIEKAANPNFALSVL